MLSPYLFAVYLDCLSLKLRKLGYGLNVLGELFGCILDADDIMLLSSSMSIMQNMLSACQQVISDLDMSFNVSKSYAIRFGPPFGADIINRETHCFYAARR